MSHGPRSQGHWKKSVECALLVLVLLLTSACGSRTHRATLKEEFEDAIHYNDVEYAVRLLDQHPWLARERFFMDLFDEKEPALMLPFRDDDASLKPQEKELLVRKMLDLGADINVQYRGYNVLWLAASKRNLPLMRYLLQEGIDPYTGSEGVWQTPLQKAMENWRKDVVRELRDYDTRSVPPLHVAAYLGDAAYVSNFIRSGKQGLNEPDFMGRTPLEYAYFGEDEETIVLLKRAGAKSSRQLEEEELGCPPGGTDQHDLGC